MGDLLNLIIVGGRGFIGSELSKALSREECLSVSVIHSGNIETFGKKLQTADSVVWLPQPDEILFKNFLRLAKKSNLKKIIYSSTLLLYPDSTESHDETGPVVPLTEYEKKKQKEEEALKKFVGQGVKVCVARLGNVYGGHKSKGIVKKIIDALNNKKPFKINGDGGHIRDYVFVDDVCEALRKLIFLSQQGDLEIYNVCSGRGVSINDLTAELEKISGKKLSVEHLSPILEKRSVVGNGEKLERATGFVPRFSLASGLTETYKRCTVLT